MSSARPNHRPFVASFAVITALSLAPEIRAGMVYQGSLQNGDYGAGQAIDTFSPNHGGSPHVLGIVDGPDGVTYTATESDDRSNALINWELPSDNRVSFRHAGTVSLWFSADRDAHVSGSLVSDNYGYTAFHNGQATFGSFLAREANEAGIEDDTVQVAWNTWHNNVWRDHIRATGLEYDRWYNIGLAWGGPGNDFELWVDGELAAAADLDSGMSFPWGFGNAATNIGLGDNHERGYNLYGSTSGATFANIEIWDEYRAFGATIPEPATLWLLGVGGLALLHRRRMR